MKTNQSHMAIEKLTARDIMSEGVDTIPANATLHQAAKFLQTNGISGAPVVDPAGNLQGMLSQTDLLKFWMRREDPGAGSDEAAAIQTSGAEEAGARTEADDLDARMVAERFSGDDRGKALVADAFTRYVIAVNASDSVPFVCSLMMARKVHRVLVLANDRPIGIITSFDVMAVLAGPMDTLEHPALRSI